MQETWHLRCAQDHQSLSTVDLKKGSESVRTKHSIKKTAKKGGKEAKIVANLIIVGLEH
jgi:hypothetical protein